MEKPKTLAQAIRYFGKEENCIRTVAEMRWPNGPACPACGHMQHYSPCSFLAEGLGRVTE